MVNELSFYTSIIAIIALCISIFNIIYTWKYNQRRIEVNIKLHDSKISGEFYDVDIELSAFNSGYHSVALLNYDFIVNDEIIEFNKIRLLKPGTKPEDYELIMPKGPVLPYVLKEGELIIISINAVEMFKVLRYGSFNGDIILSGRIETAQNKIYESKQQLKENIEGFEDWP